MDTMRFEYDFGPDDYRAYATLRDGRAGRPFSIVGCLPVLLLSLIVVLARRWLLALILIGSWVIMLVQAVTGRSPWIPLSRVPQMRKWMRRHGAIGADTFRQSVELSDDAAVIAYGPASAWPDGALKFRRTWDQWHRAYADRGALYVESSQGHLGCMAAMFGFNAMNNMARRDRNLDLFVPASQIASAGADAAELARWVNERIKAAR